MQNIDKYAYASKLKQQNPMEKLTFAMMTICVCLWANNTLISIAVLLIMSWVTIRKGRTPIPIYVKLMLVPMSFLAIGVFTIAFGISHNQNSLIFGVPISDVYIGVTKTGIATATALFFKALGSVSCLYYLSLSTPMVDILSCLQKLKCPKLLVELMGLIYRFIFVLIETADNMYVAQSSRLGYSDIRTGFRSMGALVSTLFIRAYKRSDDLYTALEARGYEGELNVLEEPFQKNFKAYVFAFIINFLLITAHLYIRRLMGGKF